MQGTHHINKNKLFDQVGNHSFKEVFLRGLKAALYEIPSLLLYLIVSILWLFIYIYVS